MIKPPKNTVVAEVARLARGVATLPSLLVTGRSLPKGRGQTVLVLPGFLTGDASTLALRTFLRRLGYRAVGWGLGRNMGRVNLLVPRVEARIDALYRESGQPIVLLGWSLGGVVAREATKLAPERIEQIITMGTPVVGGPKYTVAADSYRRRGLDLDQLERSIEEKNTAPIPARITAIYSRVDGVVAWRACIDPNPANTVEHVEVNVGHAELGLSPRVFKIIAERLGAGDGL